MIKTIIFSFLIFPAVSVAQDSYVEVENQTDEAVEVRSDTPYDYSYKDRRNRWGLEVGYQLEQISPFAYESGVPNVTITNYEDFAGSSTIPLNLVFLGGRYNTSVGSLSAGIQYGTGSVSLPSVLGTTPAGDRPASSMDITKEGIYSSIYLDTIFSEPYVVPYASLNLFRLTYFEDVTGLGTFEGTTDLTVGYVLGALFQLNWLDKESARTGLRDSGIQNTYIDVYASHYNPSNDDLDPNFETDFDFGVGLRLEF